MSSKFDFRLANPEDFLGSPLLDDDDEETLPTDHAQKHASITKPALAADQAPSVAVEAGSKTVAPLRTPKARHRSPAPSHLELADARTEVDAVNPFVDEEEFFQGQDESEDEQEAPGRSIASARRGKRQRDSRFILNKQHESILEWTEKARYTSKEQVAILLEIAPRKAARLLDRLVTQGFMDKKVQPGSASAYFLTDSGKHVVGSDVRKVDAKTGMGFVPHTLQVGWVMLMLLKRESSLTPRVEKALGRPVELSDFVTESELARAMNLEVSRLKSAAEEASFRANGFRKQALWWEGWTDLRDRAAERARQKTQAQARRVTDLAVWDLGSDERFRKPHYPDLVLRSKKRALAFEIEMSRKPASAEDIVRAYGTPDGSPYDQVLWDCRTEGVRQLVGEKVEAFSQEFKPGDEAASAAVTKFHTVQLADALQAFRVRRLAALDEAEAAAQKVNSEARARELWHVNLAGKALPCRCGAVCMAARGQFPSEQAARDLAEQVI